MDLIIPAAGQSSRFQDTRPKWLLTHPDGSLMVCAAIRGLPLEKFNRILLVVLREHVEQYKCKDGLYAAFGELGLSDKFELIILNKATQNQPETVNEAIELSNIAGAFYVKDSDNYFEIDVVPENSVSTFNLNSLKEVETGNKSYVTTNDKGLIASIVEKQIISAEFCCGGYSFESASVYKKIFSQLEAERDLYLSHMIFQMILEGTAFRTRTAEKYEDWGTKEAWNKYKSSFATIFLDIDGVIVKNSGKYFGDVWGDTDAIEKNRVLINRLYDSELVEVILTTSRTEDFREITEEQLERIGLRYHRLILGLQHGRRILIADYAPTNPYPSAYAINIQRDSDSELTEMLSAVLNKRP